MNHKAIACGFAFAIYLVQSSFATDVNPVLISAIGDPANDVAVSGSNVVVCLGDKGISILDASDPLNGTGNYPQIRSTLNTPGYASGVALSGNLALIADGLAGLEIVDVSNQTSPKIVGTYFTDGNCNGVTVQGNIAYLAEGDYGLEIVDFSNPKQPIRVGGYNTFGTANAVAVSGSYAYVADGSDGLLVVDVGNPANPRRVGGYDRLPAINVTVVGNYAYVSSNGPLITFDISNPVNPLPLSSLGLPGPVSAISVIGHMGYVASGAGGFHIVDLTDPFDPRISASNYAPSNGVRVAVSGSLALVADFGTNAPGLRIFSIANPSPMDTVGRLPIAGNIRDVAVSGNYVCVLNGQALEIVDASHPSSMHIVGRYAGYPSASNLVIVKTFAILNRMPASYPTAFHPAEVIDLSNPKNPTKVNTLSDSFVMIGPYGFEPSASGFFLYAITDTGSIQYVFGYAPTDSTFSLQDVAIRGTNAFVFGTQRSSGPLSPPLPALLKLNFFPGVEPLQWAADTQTEFVFKNYLLSFAAPNGGTTIRDSETMQILNQVNIGGTRVVLSEDTFYFANGRGGLQVAKMLDPSSPYFYNSGSCTLPDATAIGVGTNNVFVGAGTNGLYALTKFHSATRLEVQMTTNHLPRIKILGPIGTSGTLQRSTDMKTFSYLSGNNLNTYPSTIDDTNTVRAFYRFVSP